MWWILEWFNERLRPLWKNRMIFPLIYLIYGMTQWSDLSECLSKIVLVNFAVFMAGMIKPALFANFDSIIVIFFILWIAKNDHDPTKKTCTIFPGKLFMTASFWIFNCIVSFFTFYLLVLGVFIMGYIIKKIVRRPVPTDEDNQNGLKKEELTQLKTISYKKCIKAASSYEKDSCSICLSKFKASNTVILLDSCKHLFHEKCLKKWLQNQAICPYCRADVRSSVDNSEAQSATSVVSC